MRDRLWYIYLAWIVLATLLYYTVAHYSYFFNMIGASSVLMIIVAVQLQQPKRRFPWYLLALGQALFIAGDVIAYNYQAFFGIPLPYPSSADLLYLSVYPCLALGLFLMSHHRTSCRDWGGMLDSLIITVSIGTISWVFLIQPLWHESQSGLLTKLTSISYPLMDLLVMTATARLMLGPGQRVPALLLIFCGLCALFVTDSLFGWSLLHEPYIPGSGSLEIGWITFYAGLGAAALHPSMRLMIEHTEKQEDPIGWGRLILLSMAVLLPTFLQIADLLSGREIIDDQTLVGASFSLYLLVMLRMAWLIHLRDQAAIREWTLREAGAALVTATSRDSIRAAAVMAVKKLVVNSTVVRVCERNSDVPGQYKIVAGNTLLENVSFSLSELGISEHLPYDELHSISLTSVRQREILGVDDTVKSALVTMLMTGEEIQGLIVVVTGINTPPSLDVALVALSSQVALALESAQLTEALLERRSGDRFTALVKNSSDVIAVVGVDTSIKYVTPSADKVLGYVSSELEGQYFADLITPADRLRMMNVLCSTTTAESAIAVEFRILQPDGNIRHLEAKCANLMHDQNIRGIVLNIRDISERKAFESQLAHQAFHDPVTGLANRALFHDRVKHALDRRRRNGQPIAILFLDLDDFKTINDSLGHAAGDQVLCKVAEIVSASLRTSDTGARLGGDEFAVLLEGSYDHTQATRVAERLLKVLGEPFQVEGKDVVVRASIGIVNLDVGGTEDVDLEKLLRNADLAMYSAKEQGKGRYQIYDPAMHSSALRRLELKANLQMALDHDEFTLMYQPIVDLRTSTIVGIEALLRWRHPTHGIVSPMEFIPLAEETGQILPIGQWVFQEACRYIAKLQHIVRSLYIAVNLSARQLNDPALPASIERLLDNTGIDPSTLIIEITESVMVRDMDLAIARLHEFKALGVKLAIDDFGTGYSALNYLRQLPIDILKIDKSFIDDVSNKGGGWVITKAMVDLAAVLKLYTIAEGIEDIRQLDRLREMGYVLGQGYLFSAPVEPQELERLIAQGVCRPKESSPPIVEVSL